MNEIELLARQAAGGDDAADSAEAISRSSDPDFARRVLADIARSRHRADTRTLPLAALSAVMIAIIAVIVVSASQSWTTASNPLFTFTDISAWPMEIS